MGPVQRGLPVPRLPSFNHASSLILQAMNITVITLSVSIAMAKMFGRKNGYKIKANQVRRVIFE